MDTTLFTGGTVVVDWTSGARTHALATAGGRVVALGDDALALAGSPGAASVDLHDGVLAPAFGDGHAHPIFGGLEFHGPAVAQAGTVAEVAALVLAWADENPGEDWIHGAGYDSTMATDGLFDARWLDGVSRPVVLRASDYHTVWANTAALRAAGIDAATPEPPLGRIPRRPDGTPLGTLQEQAAIDLLLAASPPRSEAVRVEAIRTASAQYLAQGATWVQDAWVEAADVDTYLRAAREGALGVRINLALRVDPVRWPGQAAELQSLREEVRALGHPELTCETVKLFVDGVIENRTAAMLEPYSNAPGDRGIGNWTPEALADACATLDAAGFQLHLHAIGDAANRLALDVLEETQRTNPPRDRRPVVAHVHVLSDHDADRFASLGVIANFQPYWAQLDPVMEELTIPAIGEERARQQYRIGDVARTGAAVSFGSDWPVTSSDWRLGVGTAATRQTDDGVPGGGWLPEQIVDTRFALAAYTSGVAHQAFAADRGHLEVGASADLVWLDADPLQVRPRHLSTIRVLGTWLAGERRFDPPAESTPPNPGDTTTHENTMQETKHR